MWPQVVRFDKPFDHLADEILSEGLILNLSSCCQGIGKKVPSKPKVLLSKPKGASFPELLSQTGGLAVEEARKQLAGSRRAARQKLLPHGEEPLVLAIPCMHIH